MLDLPQYTNAMEIIIVAIGGLIGALIKDMFVDGALILPYKEDGKLYVGFIGGAVLGAFVAIFFDGNFVTALFAGYSGSALITQIVQSKLLAASEKKRKDENATARKALLNK